MRPGRRFTNRQLLVVAAALLAAVAACKSQPRPRQGAQARRDAGAALKPVTIEPAPACDLPAAPAAQPRGTVIALYHTANVVGEVEPCG
ncbi:MAG: hypothetical protein HY906_13130 [Deltaproteobacteria bacterium]|nr:hypothetical protein [Deltaproteobacteria bacterium]